MNLQEERGARRRQHKEISFVCYFEQSKKIFNLSLSKLKSSKDFGAYLLKIRH